MKNLLKYSFAFMVLTSATFGFVVKDDTYDFKALPKTGDVAGYDQKVSLSVGGQDIVVTEKVTQTIKDVSKDGGLTIEQAESDLAITVMGQAAPAPPVPGPTTMTFLPNGELLEVKADKTDPTVYRMNNLQIFLKPDKAVKVGESWTKTLAANSKTGAVAIKATYSVLGEEKVGDFPAVKVKFAIAETDAETKGSSEGTMWLSKTDNSVYKMDMTWKSMVLDGLPGPVDGVYSIVRTK